MIRRCLCVLALVASLGACAAEPSAPAAAAAPAAPAAAPVAAAPKPAPAPAAVPVSAAVEQAIRAAMKTAAPDEEIGRIQTSPIPGYSEVAMGSRIIYVSNDGGRLIQGALYDIAARVNLTGASEAVLRQALLDEVGSEGRIIFAATKPKHRITVFTDIDCGYCRRLHEQMASYNRLGISVEYLFFPRAGIGSESYDKAVSVWCAADQRSALTRAKAGQSVPAATCANPITRDYDLGRRVGVDGTPAIYAPDGTQLGGYVEPAALLARLDELAAAPAN